MYLELTNMNLLIEGRREDILNRFNENPELQKTVEEFLDHEFNKRTNYKYVNWVLKKNFDDFGNTFISLDSVINWLEKFDKVRKNLQYKDINQYKNIADLIDTLEVYGDTKSEKRSKLKSGTEKIYEDSKILVVKPLTQESSCYYGSGTRWCTAATKFANRFDQYSSQGPLYYLINKTMDQSNDYYKIAIHYDSRYDRMTLYDAQDSVNENLLGLIKTLPAFKAIESDIQQNHLYDPKKDAVNVFKNLFRNTDLLRLDRKYKIIINGKPLYLLPESERVRDKILARYGVRDVVLKIEGDELVFYALDTNIVDRNTIQEIFDYIEEDKGISITENYIERAPIRLIFDIFRIYVEENRGELEIGNDDIIYWEPKNIHSNYRFESMNLDNAYIKFLEYVKMKEKNGEPADKRDFLLNILGKDPDEVNFSGYFSTMFSSLKDAGLVTIYRAKERPYFRYKIGPNYKAWTEGRLKRI